MFKKKENHTRPFREARMDSGKETKAGRPTIRRATISKRTGIGRSLLQLLLFSVANKT